MPDPEPSIDFTQIEFPSDGLTVKDMRKAIPNGFDLPLPEQNAHNAVGWLRRRSLESVLGGTIDTEREIAALAFYAALGREPPPKNKGESLERKLGPRWQAAEALIGDYQILGLASGEHQGEEMIRKIEAQAAAQAQRFLGSSPSR